MHPRKFVFTKEGQKFQKVEGKELGSDSMYYINVLIQADVCSSRLSCHRILTSRTRVRVLNFKRRYLVARLVSHYCWPPSLLKQIR